MNFRSMRGAVVLAALLAGGCQTGFSNYSTPMPTPTPSPMDGVWSSTDGVFVANFDRGAFTSRFTATNEILAQGSYTVAGGSITMQWISVATQQRRSAVCSFTAADVVMCNQDGGGHFELKRAGLSAPMAPAGAAQPSGELAAPQG